MQPLPPASEVDPVHPLPMSKADADPLGLISLRNHSGPTALAGDAGPVVRTWVGETRSGRRPLSRLAACCAQPDPARLVGQAGPPQAWNDETAGPGLTRLSDCGTMRLCTAGAGRAATRGGWARRSGPVETPSPRVGGDSPSAETPARPVPMPSG